MQLSSLLEGVRVSKVYHAMFGHTMVIHETVVRRIQYDSRRVEKGDVFVAIKGANMDGTRFIPEAIAKGAAAIVTDDETNAPDALFRHTGVAKIVVSDTRVALAALANNFYGNPSSRLTVVGITGTNGKTTTASLVKSLLQASGKKTGLIGTIRYEIGDESIPATHTTPESLELQELLTNMEHEGCSAAVMEVSSHALHQHRVDGISFDAGVFTNLTQDHLDYHGSMEEYFRVKNLLFQMLPSDSWSVVNIDDPWGAKIAGSTRSRLCTYGLSSGANVWAENPEMTIRGTRFVLHYGSDRVPVYASLIGVFNVYNMLAAAAVGYSMDLPSATVSRVLESFRPVKGRLEQIQSPAGWTAVIDYAHTPDALEKALMALRDIRSGGVAGRIITVFGCGGNRDRGKRPLMGAIAARLSDVTVVTSDNPRHEDPDAILNEIVSGIPAGTSYERMTDRKAAICQALALARSGDIILVAGKGHEEYQIIGDQKIHFSDSEIIEEYMRSHA